MYEIINLAYIIKNKVMEYLKVKCERCGVKEHEDLMYFGSYCENCYSDLYEKWF